MKKHCRIAALLCVLLASCLLLAGCKSEAVKNAEKLIQEIGTVTLDSEAKIKAAEDALAALEEKDFKKVEGAGLVEKARADYEQLVDNKKVADVESVINAIGTVTVDSRAAIDAAHKAYDKLEPRLKEKVSNKGLIDEAEDAYLTAQAGVIEDAIRAIGTVTLDSQKDIDHAKEVYASYPESVQKRVKNADAIKTAENILANLQTKERIGKVEAMILEVGSTVTLEDEDKVKEVEKAFKALSQDEQYMVDNGYWIVNWKNQIQKLKEAKQEEAWAKLSSLMGSFKQDYDAFQNTTFYYPPGWNWYGEYWAADQRTFILPYIGANGSNRIYIRTVYNYTGGDWIFWTKLTVVVDGERFTESYSYWDVTRDNSGGTVWEYVDDDAYINMLRAIANGNSVIFRMEGSDYARDFTLSSTDKNAIKKTLELYDAMIESGVYKKW